MAKTPEQIAAEMIANLKEKTGRDMDAWRALIGSSGLVKHGEIVKMLKADHEVGHGYANSIAHEFLAASVPPADAALSWQDEQYSGAKAALRPICDALVAAIQELGGDAEFAPKKGYVSVRRAKQFVLIQPSTATRVDVGIQLKGADPTGRLEAAGSWNGMVSHRVRVSSLTEVDAELVSWIRQAYEAAR